jgi:hypothetical protein
VPPIYFHGNYNIYKEHHRFQHEANMQLCIQFPSRNQPVRAGELIKMPFVSWCDRCAWPSGTWLVATAEAHQPLPHCANNRCLIPRKRPASVHECRGAIFFPHGGIQLHTFASYALPCQVSFCQTASQLSSAAWQQNLMECWREGSTSTATSPTSAPDVVGKRSKVGGIDFGATLIIYHFPSL